jgi:negative regulator of flagellin synthesis FlgM
MKIWGEIPKVAGVYNSQKKITEATSVAGTASKKDVVSISGKAKDFQSVLKALKNVPDVRQDKVNELSERFSSGNYNVEGKDAADKILKSFLDLKV